MGEECDVVVETVHLHFSMVRLKRCSRRTQKRQRAARFIRQMCMDMQKFPKVPLHASGEPVFLPALKNSSICFGCSRWSARTVCGRFSCEQDWTHDVRFSYM